MADNLDYTYNDINHPLKLDHGDRYSFAEKGIPSVFPFEVSKIITWLLMMDFINFKR